MAFLQTIYMQDARDCRKTRNLFKPMSVLRSVSQNDRFETTETVTERVTFIPLSSNNYFNFPHVAKVPDDHRMP